MRPGFSPGFAGCRAAWCGALLGLALLAVPADAQTPGPVTTYHADAARSGHYVAPGLTWAAAARLRSDEGFDGRVTGHVYAQPLYWAPAGGPKLLIVATEDNDVVALDPDSGRVVWQRHLGEPAPHSTLPCSNVEPTGVTGTPVIDPASGTIYLDAMINGPAGPRHKVFGLSVENGAVLPGWPVDVGLAMAARGLAFVQRYQQERTALTLLGGRVFMGFGAFEGSCGGYHGMVMGFDTVTPGLAALWVARAQRGAGVWSPGGTSVADGYLFFSTGNTFRPPGAQGWDDGEGVFRETPALAHTDDAVNTFAAANYVKLEDDDLDLAGTVPVPLTLADGARRLIAMGKDGRAYLLDRDHLGGIGGALAVREVAGGAIIQAPVVYRLGEQTVVAFRAPLGICPDGRRATNVIALAVNDREMHPIWCAPVDGRGIPIVTTAGPEADPIVWVVGAEGDEKLHGYRGDTGEAVYSGGEALAGMRHFVTPMVADGHLYVAGDGRIFAFRWDE